MTDYILQEEDDLQQTIRQLVLEQAKLEVNKLVNRLENYNMDITNEYTLGVADGIATAIRVLRRETQ